jgi:hypothetical protein
MSGKKLALLLLLVLGATAGAVFAKSPGNSSGYQIIKDSSGSTKLKINTEVAADDMWLGITLYPAGVKVGSSQIQALKRGQNTQEIAISQSHKNGTFEVAVWAKKLSKDECDPGDVLCRKNGYKLTGMVSYLWGYLQ